MSVLIGQILLSYFTSVNNSSNYNFSSSSSCEGQLTLPKYYSSGMVFQAEVGTNFWGFTRTKNCDITIVQACDGRGSGRKITKHQAKIEENFDHAAKFIWNVILGESSSISVW